MSKDTDPGAFVSSAIVCTLYHSNHSVLSHATAGRGLGSNETACWSPAGLK